MAQAIVTERITNGTLTAVELTADPTRLEIRGNFSGAEVLITGGNDVTNVQPLAGPDGKPLRITGPCTLSISDFVTGDFIGGIFSQMDADSDIDIEAI
jgi:hypothetical protein